MAAVEIRGIKKRFGRKDVLRDISFDAEKGEQIAIIGRCIFRAIRPAVTAD